MIQVKAWKLSKDRWSPEETFVLIKTWAPMYLYLRCRSGTKPAWMPRHIRGRGRCSHDLVAEDWRAVAEAVNSYRDTAGLDSRRTYLQCRKRVEYLKGQYMKGEAARSGWPFIGALHAVWADEVGDHGAGAAVEGRGAPAGDGAGTAAGTFDGAAAVDGFVPSGDERSTAMIDALASAAAAAAAGFVPPGDARRGSAVEAPEGAAAAGDASRSSTEPHGAVVLEGAAEAGDAGGTGSVAARGGAFVHNHKDCRAAAVAINSCLTSNCMSSAYERGHKQGSGRVKALSDIYKKKPVVVALCAAASGGGASVDGRGEADPRRAAFVPPPIPKRPKSATAKPASSSANEPAEATVADLPAQALASGSVDAALVMSLTQIYKEQMTNMTKLGDIYKEQMTNMTKLADICKEQMTSMTKLAGIYVELKTLDVEREKAAAVHCRRA